MRLFEYQAKDVFKKYGIAVPVGVVLKAAGPAAGVSGTTGVSGTAGGSPGIPARNFADRSARTALHGAKEIGTPCVLKAQVLMGGRGKAGLVKLAAELSDVEETARSIFASTAADVRMMLVEEALDIDRELYLSITVDPVSAEGLVIASADGGMEIETLAQERPDAIIRERFDITRGLQDFQIRAISYGLGLNGDQAKQAVGIISALHKIFHDYDAELVEINPLVISGNEKLIAADGKISIDDNSSFRQSEYRLERDHFNSDMEYEAAVEGIPYLQFDGDISLMCAGAGLTTTVFDLVNYEGGTIANYLEFGGPNYTKAVRAMELCLRNPSKVVLIVTFGTIARADVMARGIVEAIGKLKPDRPIVTCIRGTNEEEAVKILSEAGLEPLFDTEEAVRRAVAIAGGEKR